MAAARPLILAGLVASCVCLIGVTPARAADAPARIVLLAAGERASVVVEFDDELPKATAIEAADNQSFDVEIGPVRGKVVNQLLQAARQSPLVTEVRVRGVPQGPEGTLIHLHVTAKTPVSGLVRRAQRRIYIDLEPLSIASASTGTAHPVAARAEATPSPVATGKPGPVDRPADATSLVAANSAAANTPGLAFGRFIF
jgi:hypothetical protein